MIFPYFSGLISFKKAPVTWGIFLLCLMSFLIQQNSHIELDEKISLSIEDTHFLTVQGKIYQEYLSAATASSEASVTAIQQSLIHRGKEGKVSAYESLGALALKDEKFLQQANKIDAWSDKVELKWWQENLTKLRQRQDVHGHYLAGILGQNSGPLKLITYQFAHGGWMHLLGNMLFMLVLAGFIEQIFGGAFLLLLYLGSGIFAALGFLWISGNTYTPLIGASGAVSGLAAFVSTYFFRKKVRYAYFLFIPHKKYLGFVSLPAWLAGLMWLIADLTGYMSQWTEFGGIAHAAHLGGEFAGAGLALGMLWISRSTKQFKYDLKAT